MAEALRENKLEPVAPALSAETVAQADADGKRARGDKAGEKVTEKPTDKAAEKAEKPRTKDSGAVLSEKSRKSDS